MIGSDTIEDFTSEVLATESTIIIPVFKHNFLREALIAVKQAAVEGSDEPLEKFWQDHDVRRVSSG